MYFFVRYLTLLTIIGAGGVVPKCIVTVSALCLTPYNPRFVSAMNSAPTSLNYLESLPHGEELLAKLSSYLTPEEIEHKIELIEKINHLKVEKKAIILGHNYMTPDVFYGVSDFTGDSLALAKDAMESSAEMIIFAGVYFMAETAKILNPDTRVIIPDEEAGCSLSEAVTAEEVMRFKKDYPDVPVVTYINSSAAVKAVSDIICTSANAHKVVNSLEADTILFLPDSYLAANVQKRTNKKVISWNGKCMVHELFSEMDIELARKNFPNVKVVSHPECKPEVTKISDFTGSTSEIEKYISSEKPQQVLLLTECSMGDNIKTRQSDVEFVSTCQMCPHMQKITLEKILESLETETPEVNVDLDTAERAKTALVRMLDIGR